MAPASLPVRAAAASELLQLPGALSIDSGDVDSVIVITGRGLWTVEQMAEHLDAYRRLLARRRRRQQPVRVLVLLEHAGVQVAAVTQALTAGLKTCHQSGDRVAMVVPSALARVQMRRVLSTDVHGYFVSEASARVWLAETLS